jgi:N-acetylmuramoyl-L-alanine amidase
MVLKDTIRINFQKWYNKVTQTKAPLTEDGIYGPLTEEALQKIINIIREF